MKLIIIVIIIIVLLILMIYINYKLFGSHGSYKLMPRIQSDNDLFDMDTKDITLTFDENSKNIIYNLNNKINNSNPLTFGFNGTFADVGLKLSFKRAVENFYKNTPTPGQTIINIFNYIFDKKYLDKNAIPNELITFCMCKNDQILKMNYDESNIYDILKHQIKSIDKIETDKDNNMYLKISYKYSEIKMIENFIIGNVKKYNSVNVNSDLIGLVSIIQLLNKMTKELENKPCKITYDNLNLCVQFLQNIMKIPLISNVSNSKEYYNLLNNLSNLCQIKRKSQNQWREIKNNVDEILEKINNNFKLNITDDMRTICFNELDYGIGFNLFSGTFENVENIFTEKFDAIITFEANENYVNYHWYKSLVSDLRNILYLKQKQYENSFGTIHICYDIKKQFSLYDNLKNIKQIYNRTNKNLINDFADNVLTKYLQYLIALMKPYTCVLLLSNNTYNANKPVSIGLFDIRENFQTLIRKILQFYIKNTSELKLENITKEEYHGIFTEILGYFGISIYGRDDLKIQNCITEFNINDILIKIPDITKSILQKSKMNDNDIQTYLNLQHQIINSDEFKNLFNKYIQRYESLNFNIADNICLYDFYPESENYSDDELDIKKFNDWFKIWGNKCCEPDGIAFFKF